MWQPIETAPKDGSWILVFGDRYDRESLPPIGAARWEVRTFQSWQQVSDTRKELVTEDASDWDCESGIAPTHWQPLPEPPTA